MMTVLTASWARDNFAEVLMLAQRGPMAIARRGRVMAVVWPAGTEAQQDRERRLLDYQRRLPALERLLFHRDIAMRLLTMTDDQASSWLVKAHPTLEKWYAHSHISHRQLLRWRWALARPRPVLAWIISDTSLFGHLLRERSPLLLLDFPDRPAERQAVRALRLLTEQKLEWAERDPPYPHEGPVPEWVAEHEAFLQQCRHRLGDELPRDEAFLDEGLLDEGRWRDDAAWSEVV